MKFIFDLDGTITSKETLPLISNHFGIDKQIKQLTEETVQGNIPFIESFIRRVQILGNLPVIKINELLEQVPLSEKVLQFIKENKEDCIIATGNLSCWVEKLVNRIGCKTYTSEGVIENGKIKKLKKILKKEDIIKKYKALGEEVVFVGDGNNDAEAMREADISIACGLIHYPAKSVLSVADYAVFDENALYRLLNQIISPPNNGKSLVLSCAGIGSRLGLGKTKALIDIEGKPLIYWQLEQFADIKDIRIVIGFQANDVIKTVLKKRKDLIFVYNHNYFSTKTGASFYLGARHGNKYSIAWDGDLLVHPKDIDRCLNYEGEFIGCSKTITDDAVLASVDENNNVISFSRKVGDYEWSGPACLKREHIKFVSNHVYHLIEEYLPLAALIVEAQDIDTYEDYLKAIEFIKSWKDGE
jgi:HAD superfamily phosphoserine phosphatase-like hydrolase